MKTGNKVEKRKDATLHQWDSCKISALLDSKTLQLESLKCILKGEADCSYSTSVCVCVCVCLHCSADIYHMGARSSVSGYVVCAKLGS